MSIVLTIISVIAALIVLMLIIALFVKKDYNIIREVNINKPNEQVFEYIKYLKNQDNYSAWNKLDPAMKKTYTGTDGTVGFKYEWDSTHKQAGKGAQEIIGITPGEKVDMQIHFIKPFEGMAKAFMSTTPVNSNQTNVKWGIASQMKYPMNVMLLFLNMENMIGKDLASGLTSLKEILEQKQVL